jgi:hypothetical protein
MTSYNELCTSHAETDDRDLRDHVRTYVNSAQFQLMGLVSCSAAEQGCNDRV